MTYIQLAQEFNLTMEELYGYDTDQYANEEIDATFALEGAVESIRQFGPLNEKEQRALAQAEAVLA